ncbi:sugar translocase [Camelimonas fluminis]|uniref:AAA family ATPase n=1 Tax=Camelimonas fluminis TaxID=1576911 RepID=A0ABV7UHN7_9HYPH|nr:AAA family ATPase [Camelimonas fluminis]GHE77241.1 sugar translocase [Camelimonas fluminis]
MRIERLDLTRYGRFTDQTLDFGPARPGKPDLHIVLGPNEAGKTTALNAWLDLLYGMAPNTPYAFQHGYELMRVGARLALADGVRDYVRVKRARNSLLDADGNPVPDDALAEAMGGLGRAAYANMFSLDADALEAGGKEAIASKGQLGEMLFSASAGLGALSGALGDLRARADAFWKPRGRNTELGRLKSELAELRQQRDAIDVIASRHATLRTELERCLASYEAASRNQGQLRRRSDDIRGVLAALDLAPRLAAQRARLAELPEHPDAPAAWADRVGELIVEQARVQESLRAQRQREEELAQRLAAIPLDDAGLRLGAELPALDEPHAQYVSVSRSLPNRRHDLETSALDAKTLLRQLERPADDDAAALLLPGRLVLTFRELIDRRAVIDAQFQDAHREYADAQAALEQAEASLGDLPEVMADTALTLDGEWLARLAVAADHARQSGFDRRLAALRRDVADASARLDQRLQLLAPWRGDARALAAMATPAASMLEALERELADALRARDHLGQTIEGQRADLDKTLAQLAGLARITGAVDETGVTQARARREQAWAAHLLALDAASAGAFEAAMRHDDMVAETRLTRQKELLQAVQLRQQQAQIEQRLAQLETRLVAAESRIGELRQQTRGLAGALSPELAAFDAPDALADWLQRRQHALETWEPLLAKQQQLAETTALQNEAMAELHALLAPAGIVDGSDSLANLVAAADRLRSAADASRRQRDEQRRTARESQNRKRALERVEAAAGAWSAEWAEACAACWLGALRPLPAPAQVRAALDVLPQLEATLAKRQDLASRVGKMERDRQLFADAVLSLARRHAAVDETADDAGGALALYQRLQARAAAAGEARRRRQDIQNEQAEVRERLQQLAQQAALLEAEATRITGHLRVETLTEAQRALAATQKRREALAQIGELEQQILQHTGAATIADADRQLADADRGALQADAATLEAEIDAAHAHVLELHAERRRLEKAIADIGSDAAAAQLETRRQTVLLEIDGKARDYLKLRLGVAATEQALSAWRDSHRSSLLRRASEAFGQMSCGAWAGLTAQPGASGEVLVAIDRENRPKEVEKLSKGARFQLYLALRIAAFHDFAAGRTPPPFVADDVMETFDDARAAATLDLFAEMAGRAQVIYLTHHRHLCDIAAQRCPDAILHELSA